MNRTPQLTARDQKRVSALLGLRDDHWSHTTLKHLAEIQWGNQLSKRQHTPEARERLERFRAAVRSALQALKGMDDLGLEAWLLRGAKSPRGSWVYDRGLEAWLLRGATGEAFDVSAERERLESLLVRIERALDNAYRTHRNTAEHIRALALLYESHHHTKPSSTPGGKFHELVRIILKQNSPGKEIRAALK